MWAEFVVAAGVFSSATSFRWSKPPMDRELAIGDDRKGSGLRRSSFVDMLTRLRFTPLALYEVRNGEGELGA